MKQSKIFVKTRKEAPKDEVSKSAKLLIRAGFINKEMAGVYTLLPFGLKTLRKIENIIRDEMNAVGGVELSMTALQESKNWEKSGRWDDEVLDVWFKTLLKNGTQLGLATTHEEPLTNLMKDHIHSYKDLPAYAYQFQTKFRNELRAKSGIMRGREFLMKDLYSFSKDQKQHDDFYEKMKQVYKNIFNKVGIGEKTFLTFSGGGSFSKYSHEFQTLTDAGEDLIYVDYDKGIAINKEVFIDEVINDLGLDKNNLKEEKAVETGNIFNLGTRFSDALELVFDDEDGKRKPVIMGSYGIGLGRLMGVVAEILSDEKGLIWPESISPFQVHLLNVSSDNSEAIKIADEIYENFVQNNIEVLYDDRSKSPAEKIADANLIGISKQIIIGTKGIASGEFEIIDRKSGKISKISENEIMNLDFLKR